MGAKRKASTPKTTTLSVAERERYEEEIRTLRANLVLEGAAQVGETIHHASETLRDWLNDLHEERRKGVPDVLTREEWKGVAEAIDIIAGVSIFLDNIVNGEKPELATCGWPSTPHPDDGEVYDDGANLHFHFGRECRAILKNHDVDENESDAARKQRLDDVRRMFIGKWELPKPAAPEPEPT